MDTLQLLVNNAALLSGAYLQVLSSTCTRDRAKDEELMVKMPKVMAQLIADVYEMKEQSLPGELESNLKVTCRWKTLGYEKTSLEELEVTVQAPGGEGIWYAVFKKKESSIRHQNAPAFVIAVRGTRMPDWQDLESNARVIGQFLHTDKRYLHLKEMAECLVDKFGHLNVWITGHSLGAALALLVAKGLVKRKTPVQTHLYNPPFEFATFAWVGNSQALRKLERACMLILVGMHQLLHPRFSSLGAHDRLLMASRDAQSTAKWTPHLYLNEGDFISQGYISYFLDKASVRAGGFRERVHRWVEGHSLLSLISPSTSVPNQRLTTANVTISPSYGFNFRKCHGVGQWYEDWQWKSGREVEKVSFGRQIAQRVYRMKRVYDSETKIVTYAQTVWSTGFQTGWSTVTGGLGTSRRKEVVFMFSNQGDAEIALDSWPDQLHNAEINDRCIQGQGCFEFKLNKFRKGAVTFYVYAVKRTHTDFEQEVEWVTMMQKFQKMGDIKNWIKDIRMAVVATALILC